jgi:hypothetical protein
VTVAQSHLPLGLEEGLEFNGGEGRGSSEAAGSVRKKGMIEEGGGVRMRSLDRSRGVPK